MQFKKGTTVYTAENDKVGTIERVVMRPKDNEVTHFVVEKGFLFKKDRVLPIALIAHTEPDKVVLKSDFSKDDFNELPEFEDTLYIPAHEMDHYDAADAGRPVTAPPAAGANVYPYYYYGAYGAAPAWNFAPPFWSNPDYVSYEVTNIPEDTVVLEPGMDIITLDDEEVGSLEDVFVDSGRERVTHFTISKGLIFETTKAIPVHWIDYVDEKHIHLSVTKRTIENLPEYEGQPA